MKKKETVKRVKECIEKTLKDFRKDSMSFFHEKEVHCLFWKNAQRKFEIVKTDDRIAVSVFRHEYQNFGRYFQRVGIHTKYNVRGGRATFDFAVLEEDFVSNNKYIKVINKDDNLIKSIKDRASKGKILCAIEFKMIFRGHNANNIKSKYRNFVYEIENDITKMRQEEIEYAFIVGLNNYQKAAPKSFNEDIKKILELNKYPGKIFIYYIEPNWNYKNQDEFENNTEINNKKENWNKFLITE